MTTRTRMDWWAIGAYVLVLLLVVNIACQMVAHTPGPWTYLEDS